MAWHDIVCGGYPVLRIARVGELCLAMASFLQAQNKDVPLVRALAPRGRLGVTVLYMQSVRTRRRGASGLTMVCWRAHASGLTMICWRAGVRMPEYQLGRA